ncbi:hypothetical protein TNIN_157411 [Trichonephila inaurata madagascariensis]|uniref:Uncharacterized protein n=1 Tax=Trichonephila inaurata madagascariensis TaxID=2747483 RepID=A0A8X6YZ66_9ARAC|nr:hypothetical protein TNIN_157411 [Trichonephila inaurata madagascariensis]
MWRRAGLWMWGLEEHRENLSLDLRPRGDPGTSQQGRFDIQRRIIDNGIQEEPRRGVKKDKFPSTQDPSSSQ